MINVLFTGLVLFGTVLLSYPIIGIRRIVVRSKQGNKVNEYYKRNSGNSNRVYHIG